MGRLGEFRGASPAVLLGNTAPRDCGPIPIPLPPGATRAKLEAEARALAVARGHELAAAARERQWLFCWTERRADDSVVHHRQPLVRNQAGAFEADMGGCRLEN
jgi:hypothetical protein